MKQEIETYIEEQYKLLEKNKVQNNTQGKQERPLAEA